MGKRLQVLQVIILLLLLLVLFLNLTEINDGADLAADGVSEHNRFTRDVEQTPSVDNVNNAKNAHAANARVSNGQTQPNAQQSILRVNFKPIKTEYGAEFFNVTNAELLELYRGMKPTIPHIIHQTWKTEIVPKVFKPWIQSVLDLHPHWQYYFWTDDDVECFIGQRYNASHLENFRNYPSGIFRGDALRYYILYEFGGVYMDLDHIAMKPLDYWTYERQAFIAHENYEHAYLRRNYQRPFLINSIIGGRPKHPYFKLLIDSLIPAAQTHQDAKGDRVLYNTGPFFVTGVLDRLRNTTATKPGAGAENGAAGKPAGAAGGAAGGASGGASASGAGGDASVTVLPPRYFLPMFDPVHPKYDLKCSELTPNEKNRHKVKLCEEMKARNFENSISPEAFLNHLWVHTNSPRWADSLDSKQFFNISEVFPRSRYVSSVYRCKK